MFQNIQAVIFDLDGTLLNTLDDLRNSVNAALKMHGLPEKVRISELPHGAKICATPTLMLLLRE